MNERRETGPPKGHVAAGTCTDFGPLRQQLVESLAERGVFREPWLREVFETVYRHFLWNLFCQVTPGWVTLLPSGQWCSERLSASGNDSSSVAGHGGVSGP